MDTTTNDFIADDRSWQKVIMKYNRPDLSKSLWQICNSLIPYLGLWYLMVLSLEYSYWITLALSFIASGFLIRLFIIFHDCGHGSFFKSKRTNKIVGMTLGILAFTPYFKWHNQHHIHHATTGNLDKRGIGDVWTLTVKEYLESSKWRRFFYRAFRNPFILFTIGSAYVILIQNRFSKKEMTTKERWNIYFTNFMILVMAIGISLMVGLKAFLLIQFLTAPDCGCFTSSTSSKMFRGTGAVTGIIKRQRLRVARSLNCLWFCNGSQGISVFIRFTI